jgi:tRNA pseudouridine38-40 synthase
MMAVLVSWALIYISVHHMTISMFVVQVALLLQVGKEALPPDIVPIIIAARDRKELAKVALSAPPHGLYLMSVNYDKEILEPPEGSPPISFGRTHQLSKCKLPFY